MSWQSILKTFIVGTERSPLPERDIAPLGLSPGGDPAQTALESLAAVNLLRKAASPLPHSVLPTPQSSLPNPQSLPVCSAAAVKDLQFILSGRYTGALPEFLALLVQKELRLPPELLPDVLEKTARDAASIEQIRPALGLRGEWLARQHPRWNALLAGEAADWFTATFAERKLLLSQTRTLNPLLALAWLEKTWPEEKADHKAQFIEMLNVRLSPADEGLLEKAFSDKSREVRRAAAQALLKLPESRIFSAAKVFFKERFAGVFLQKGRPEMEVFLKNALPDLSDDAIAPWLAILPKDALPDWRNELLRLFIRLFPPAELQAMAGLSREKLLERLDDLKCETALLEAIERHNDDSWTEAVLLHYSRDFRNSVWQSKPMIAFLTLFAPAAMDFLKKNNHALNYDNQAILRSLENYRRPWPKSLIENLLELYRSPAYGSGDIPGWHFAAVLHTAAYHCHPTDVAGSPFVRDYLQNPPKARPREMEEFLGIIRFRTGMHGHLSSV